MARHGNQDFRGVIDEIEGARNNVAVFGDNKTGRRPHRLAKCRSLRPGDHAIRAAQRDDLHNRRRNGLDRFLNALFDQIVDIFLLLLGKTLTFM